MCRLLKGFVFTLVLVTVCSTSIVAQDATEIMQRAYDRMQGNSSTAEITMTIVRPTWERSVSFKSWSLGQDYSMILTTAPARDEGTAFLMRENEIWNWLPDVNRTIKMPPSMMSQSWMGSDFSNNDLVRESSVVTDYTHILAGDSTISGYDCYKIEMTPKPEAAIVWAKVYTYVSKDEYLQLRSEFYDEDDFLVRIMNGSEVKEMGGRLIPTKMEMIPVEEIGNKTIITYQSLEFDVGLTEKFFSIQNMKRVE
ncbi:MAG: outer membrane lipoprotein-sorting protein [Balneola sp.]|jgi:outer membrane lipoprotein-sorting protein|nr:outer membrane lipoprotein-sorting protein [Balneola sp.]MBE78484.1 outer membrane lipoprotein-sorting protein [Balneola sp.]HBX66905.1 outer membrane lipoprotein-sorting protein [Balneolaceae bacterium]|tara:strand:- start:186 stop:944 length:759 start_codon:yes stop_codon:yes gene_type:complete